MVSLRMMRELGRDGPVGSKTSSVFSHASKEIQLFVLHYVNNFIKINIHIFYKSIPIMQSLMKQFFVPPMLFSLLFFNINGEWCRCIWEQCKIRHNALLAALHKLMACSVLTDTTHNLNSWMNQLSDEVALCIRFTSYRHDIHIFYFTLYT